jgi:hypothetical protein
MEQNGGKHMRRLATAAALLGVVVGTLVAMAGPAGAQLPLPSGVTEGSATIVVSHDPSGFDAWAVSLDGQVASSGRAYTGTASGTTVEEYSEPTLSFSGATGSSSLTGSCYGDPTFVPVTDTRVPHPLAPAGLLRELCSVSIDGAPTTDVDLVLALAPTATLNTYTGIFTAVPDSSQLPALSPASVGTASMEASSWSNSVSFAFDGQIYRGHAAGGASDNASTVTLSGTSASGSLSATCTDMWEGAELDIGMGGAAAVLDCNGSVNGGPPGHVTLVSAYRADGFDYLARAQYYTGAFVGG